MKEQTKKEQKHSFYEVWLRRIGITSSGLIALSTLLGEKKIIIQTLFYSTLVVDSFNSWWIYPHPQWQMRGTYKGEYLEQ